MFVALIIDCFINLLFIVLSYGSFQDYYYKLCWCVHYQCGQSTKKLMHNSGENIKRIESEIKSEVEVKVNVTKTSNKVHMVLAIYPDSILYSDYYTKFWASTFLFFFFAIL